MAHDLVVFVPGVMGSVLQDAEGNDVWNLSLRVGGRLTLGMERFFQRLTLRKGLGDEAPDDPQALRPTALLKEPQVYPGLLPHVAYRGLARHLKELDEGRVAVFPYDWRLSNRHSARALKVFVERELTRWRERRRAAGDAEEPRVVFVCHSMGGLVTRYYLEVLGGREVARSLVTLGTPFAGSVKAVRVLSGTLSGRKLLGVGDRLRDALVEAARTMPAVHQLLPTYQCVTAHSDGTRLDSVSVPDLDSAWVTDAFAFRRELDTAVRTNTAEDLLAGRPAPYRVFASGGKGEPTDVTLSLSAGDITYADTLGNRDRWQGDGTVPCLSATPPEWEDGARVDWFRLGHTALPNDGLLHRQLRDRYEALDHRPYQVLGTSFGMDVPEAVAAGTPLPVTAVSEDPDLLLEARLVAPDGGKPVERRRLRPDGDGGYHATLTPPPGVWLVEAAAVHATGIPVQREAVVVLD
ncbi:MULTISPECIES: esterase/lipase family protein [Streptomyces]|uniref:Esterase/lipase family protein n=1 Tax=Streptomyces fimbriatus TaxID=68197 RepID=A0ABW0D781_STRFI